MVLNFFLGVFLDFVLFIFSATAIHTVFGWMGVGLLLLGNCLVILLHSSVRRRIHVARPRT